MTVSDEHGEIVHWIQDEWEEDPSVTISIANAIKMYYEQGVRALRKSVGKEVRFVMSKPCEVRRG